MKTTICVSQANAQRQQANSGAVDLGPQKPKGNEEAGEKGSKVSKPKGGGGFGPGDLLLTAVGISALLAYGAEKARNNENESGSGGSGNCPKTSGDAGYPVCWSRSSQGGIMATTIGFPVPSVVSAVQATCTQWE